MDWDGSACSQSWTQLSTYTHTHTHTHTHILFSGNLIMLQVKMFTSFKSISDLFICCNKWHHLIPLSIFWGQNLHLSHDMRCVNSSVLEMSLNLHTSPRLSGGRVRFPVSLHPLLHIYSSLSTLIMSYVKVCVLSLFNWKLVNREVFESKELVLFTLVAVGLAQCLELQGSRVCEVKWERSLPKLAGRH